MKEEEVLTFASQAEWAAWLAKNHSKSAGVWLRLAKKASGEVSVSYAEAVETALCYGWIDSQRKSGGAKYSLQRFTPRSKRSVWSKLNREKALALIAQKKMKAPGLREIERAKADGRWDAAYDSPRTAQVPEDLQVALKRNSAAKAFFATLDSRNRYAILHRLQTAKKPETRARRIEQFVEMLARKEKLYP